MRFEDGPLVVFQVESLNYSPTSPRTRPEGSFTRWGATKSWMKRIGGEFKVTMLGPKEDSLLEVLASDVVMSSLLDDEPEDKKDA